MNWKIKVPVDTDTKRNLNRLIPDNDDDDDDVFLSFVRSDVRK